ncbi:MAG: aldo/keto reductase [Candidatus Dormibacteria bacterium]
MEHGNLSAAAAGSILIGDLRVNRLGFGAMQITGEGVWGAPRDHAASIAVLRRAVELGTTLIDTADSYGPHVSEELIAEALHPYPDDLVIATKAGFERSGPGRWEANRSPDHLRAACEGSLRRLRVDRIDLYQLHNVSGDWPLSESIGVLTELRAAGKIRHIGVSNVTIAQLAEARRHTEVVSVQNRYNLTDRHSEDVLDECAREGIAFIPWFPLATGELARPGNRLDRLAREHDAAPSQVALAWLLARSSAMLPIPGTKSVAHLEENIAGAALSLTEEQRRAL